MSRPEASADTAGAVHVPQHRLHLAQDALLAGAGVDGGPARGRARAPAAVRLAANPDPPSSRCRGCSRCSSPTQPLSWKVRLRALPLMLHAAARASSWSIWPLLWKVQPGCHQFSMCSLPARRLLPHCTPTSMYKRPAAECCVRNWCFEIVALLPAFRLTPVMLQCAHGTLRIEINPLCTRQPARLRTI